MDCLLRWLEASQGYCDALHAKLFRYYHYYVFVERGPVSTKPLRLAYAHARCMTYHIAPAAAPLPRLPRLPRLVRRVVSRRLANALLR